MSSDHTQYISRNIISAIIFDVDGVLIDTVPLHFRAWQKAFAEEDINFEKKDYKRINGIPRDAGVRIILQTDNIDCITEVGDRKQAYYLALLAKSPPQPLPGVLPFLLQVKKMGWRIAAASSSKNAASVLTSACLIEYFDTVITGNDFKKSKPDPDIFLTAASTLGVIPALAVVVEDAVNGVMAAVAGGFYCIAVANSESSDDLYAAGASAVISTTSQLTLDLFRNLDSA